MGTDLVPAAQKDADDDYKLCTPKSIYNNLNECVVGQEDAKKALSVAVFLHISRLLAAYAIKRPPFKKSNLMLIGPTGVGKTFMMQVIRDTCDIPVFHINAKDIVSSGYKGTSIDKYFEMFIEQEEGDIALAENSIIFVDEFDKLCLPSSGNEAGAFNKPVQYALLKAIEGNEYSLEGGATYSTENVLFVLGGNFQHMRDDRKENKPAPTLGFVAPSEKAPKKKELHEELIAHGVVRELAGRISTVAELHELTRPQLRKAFDAKKDSILTQYQELFKFLGKNFSLSPYKINKVLDRCLANGTGARGLQTALDEQLRDYIFNLDVDMDYRDYCEQAEENREPAAPGNELTPYMYSTIMVNGKEIDINEFLRDGRGRAR